MIHWGCILVERSVDWIKQTRRDLENAEYEIEGGFYEWACFLSQQAAEKALKAVFQRLGAEAFGHSVAALITKLPDDLKPNKKLLVMARELDKAYIPTRYPHVHPEGAPYEVYTEEETERLVGCAKEVVEYGEGILSRV